MDLQAQDRAHRIGQRSDVSVFRLVTYSPVEEKILSRATEKMNVSQLVVESGKFNKDSVDSDNSLERKRLMEILLTDFDTAQPKAATEKSGSDDEDDDGAGSVSSDKEDLNELLSNNEADFQLYSEYDQKIAVEGGGPAPLFSSEKDVPDWIRYPQATGRQSVFTAASEESRKRKEVSYDDGMTEKQFMRLMDKQSVQEEHAKKKQKKTKGTGRPVTKALVEDEEMLDESPSGASLLTDWTYRKLISCGKSVVALKDPITKRRLSEIFLEKPDPATFPDYYEIIEKPIAINDILRKCRAKIYNAISEFKDDWKLMFSNAAKFNGADSWVVQDAQSLEKELERILKKNGFVDDLKPPTCKEKKPLPRIRLTLTKK
jgi:Bromodomain/Snf2-ATP coupling, chromatin remodelling complex